MKTSVILKVFVVLPIILFVDYILMVLIGCASCLLGFGEGYYCNTYCVIGKIILLASAILYGFIIYPDVKKYVNSKKKIDTITE